MEHPPYSLHLASCDLFLFSAMKQAFMGNILILLMTVLWVGRHFWEEFLLTPCIPFFKDRYGYCGYSVRAAENTLSEHYKIAYLRL
jgi:hypothetical protein